MFPTSRAARLRMQYSLGELDSLELRWIDDLDPDTEHAELESLETTRVLELV